MPETPAFKLAAKLAELSGVGTELAELDDRRDDLAARRDALLLEIRQIPGSPSLRDLGALGRVSHAWIRKLEAAAG